MDIMGAFKATTDTIRSWADQKIPTKFEVVDDQLYLANEFGVISEGITLPSGGGGGGGGGYVTLKNQLPSTTVTVAAGSSANLTFEYKSTADEGNYGTLTVYVSNTLRDTFNIPQGINTIDVSQYLSTDGGATDVKITCTDSYGNQKSLLYTLNVIALKLTSTFDDSQIYSEGIDIRYTAYGAVEKTIIFVLDGRVYDTITTSETGRQRTFTIEHQEHGTHSLVIYATATVSGTEVKSNELLYDVMFVDSGVTAPMISSACDVKSITQGENLSIGFAVYDPVNMEAEITLTIKNGDEVYSTSTRTVDRTRQIWSTRNYPVGERVQFIITYGTTSKVHTITVLKNDIDVSIKTTDLEFNLRAAGKSNSDSNRDVWTSGEITTTFQNLNWVSNGWLDDGNGDTALRLSGGAKAIINYQPFKTDARTTGRTIEFTYAIRDVNDRKAIAMSCMNDAGVGFYVTADTSAFSSEQTTVSCNYADEEKLTVAYVIEPRSDKTRLLSVYLNGILSGVKQYPETDNFQQSAPLYITVGSPYCSIDLYSIRSYNAALTAAEVGDNYIADVTDIATQLAIYEDNDIYDLYGNLSFSKVQSKIPTFLITGDLPTYKGDKKKVKISFTHPEKPSLNYIDDATLDVQGTSSQFSKFWEPY